VKDFNCHFNYLSYFFIFYFAPDGGEYILMYLSKSINQS
jgi:hypothetical protein